jgi:hypothetical protein
MQKKILNQQNIKGWNCKKKKSKTSEIAIKRMWTKSDVKIIWNQMLRNKIKNKIQLEK